MVSRGKSTSTSAERAIRVYLKDKDSPGPGWTYPTVPPARKPVDAVQMQLDLDAELWQALSQEAINQDVTVQQLLEHAVLYFAAEDNAGRVTERIIEDLDEELRRRLRTRAGRRPGRRRARSTWPEGCGGHDGAGRGRSSRISAESPRSPSGERPAMWRRISTSR